MAAAVFAAAFLAPSSEAVPQIPGMSQDEVQAKMNEAMKKWTEDEQKKRDSREAEIAAVNAKEQEWVKANLLFSMTGFVVDDRTVSTKDKATKKKIKLTIANIKTVAGKEEEAKETLKSIVVGNMIAYKRLGGDDDNRIVELWTVEGKHVANQMVEAGVSEKTEEYSDVVGDDVMEVRKAKDMDRREQEMLAEEEEKRKKAKAAAEEKAAKAAETAKGEF